MKCAMEYGRFRHLAIRLTGSLDDVTSLIREREANGFELVTLLERTDILDSYYIVFKRLVTVHNINATDWQ